MVCFDLVFFRHGRIMAYTLPVAYDDVGVKRKLSERRQALLLLEINLTF
jgi:hypothetical protein